MALNSFQIETRKNLTKYISHTLQSRGVYRALISVISLALANIVIKRSISINVDCLNNTKLWPLSVPNLHLNSICVATWIIRNKRNFQIPKVKLVALALKCDFQHLIMKIIVLTLILIHPVVNMITKFVRNHKMSHSHLRLVIVF